MEQNRPKYNLNNLFQDLTTNGLNEQNKNNITNFLMEVIDSKNENIFNDNVFHSFILLLKNSKENTLLISHLLEEIDLKIIRLGWIKSLNSNQHCNCNNQKTNTNSMNQNENFNLSPLSKAAEAITNKNQQQRRPNN